MSYKPPRSGSRSSGGARLALVGAPTPTMPDGRPPALGTLAGLEVFACLPYATKLTRPSCASRWRDGQRVQRDGSGPVIPGHESPRERALQVEKCHGCPAGAVHNEEFPAGSARPVSVPPPPTEEEEQEAVVPNPKNVEAGRAGGAAVRAKGAHLTYNGESLSIAEWADRIGVTVEGIRKRLKAGRPIEQVLARGGLPRGRNVHGAPRTPAAAPAAAAPVKPTPAKPRAGATPSDDGTAEGVAGLVTFLRAAGYRVAVAGRVPAGIAIIVGDSTPP